MKTSRCFAPWTMGVQAWSFAAFGASVAASLWTAVQQGLGVLHLSTARHGADTSCNLSSFYKQGMMQTSSNGSSSSATPCLRALASDARGASSDSDDAFLESLCRAPKARRSCPVAALGGTGGASSDDEFVGGLCKAPRNHALFAALPSPAAAPRAADAADTLSRPKEFADFPPRVATQPLARARGRSLNPQRRETCELGPLTPRPVVEDDWGHGQLAARMQAQIVELTDCFRDQIATQDLPITLHLSTSTVGCEDALRSIVVDVRTAWQFYVGATVDPVRRWLGDANPSRWLGEGGDDVAIGFAPATSSNLVCSWPKHGSNMADQE